MRCQATQSGSKVVNPDEYRSDEHLQSIPRDLHVDYS